MVLGFIRLNKYLFIYLNLKAERQLIVQLRIIIGIVIINNCKQIHR